ncbi:hypothetical protein AYO45_03320 [Gammaproteobacteria bacterium SCGC AG-212-F23]|nr:hypothetical protein AYO45_03320 [Gammaproteobacteria bacterium SCGC AG-212-F23]
MQQHLIFQKSQSIACYLPREEEFNSMPMIQAIWRSGKKCYLPVLLPDRSLVFASYKINDALVPNRYNILEPENTERIPAQQLDLVLMPLVAFDENGGRLGMGGGYYDRTFAFTKKAVSTKPFLMGVAYALQQVDMLPQDEWDVVLDGIITELDCRQI